MIGWRDGEDKLQRGSLFAAFAALARGEAWSFPALRPHQREAWHSFTVQCAAMAMIRAGASTPPEDEAGWRELLVALADGWAGVWELVVDDWSKPALLQPPVSSEADYKNRLPTPDALDMLATAKNHDVKQERIAEASDEDWLFALVTLQTSEGYGGRDNHGISRMNGGLSNRMSLSVRPAGGAGAVFRRDLGLLLADARGRTDRRGGTPLLWMKEWDGTEMLGYPTLDELYVEICRRVRLRRGSHGIDAMSATSKEPRVAGKANRGVTKDPWAPIKRKEPRESVTASGVGYRAMARLLDKKEVDLPLLAQFADTDDDEGLSIVAVALVRGQGKTEGLHRRAIPTSRRREIEEYGPEEDRVLDKVGFLAERRSTEAWEARSILRRALICLVQGGSEQPRYDDDSKVEPWLRQFDREVDDELFGKLLWDEAAGDRKLYRTLWRTQLRDIAQKILADADEAAPRTVMRRVKAIANARSKLGREMNSWLRKAPDVE